MLRYQPTNETAETEEAEAEEETEKPLGVVTEIDTLIFLVTLRYLSALLLKHPVDITDVLLP